MPTQLTPYVWFNRDIENQVHEYDKQHHENLFLEALTQEDHPIVTCESLPSEIHVVTDSDTEDDDIKTDFRHAANALWKGSADDRSSDSTCLASQYHAIKHGKQMCKLNENQHLFGQSLDFDNSMMECFMAYGVRTEKDVHPKHFKSPGLIDAIRAETLHPVQIVLQVDSALGPSPAQLKSQGKPFIGVPLKHEDIEYREEIIGDLNKEDESQREAYFKAITDEMSSLSALTFAEVTLIPDDTDPTTTRFVLKVKKKADGSYWKHKARLVVRGFMQRVGLDFYTTFSPMSTLNSCRIVLATAIKHGIPCKHIDIPNAFIQEHAERDLYIELPKGLVLSKAIQQEARNRNKGSNCRVGLRLLKALYGLKQAPLLWNLRINDFFTKQGLVRQTADACLYKYERNGKFVLLSISVDDILVTGTDVDKIKSLQDELNKAFSIDINGVTKYCDVSDNVESFLGILVTGKCADGRIVLSCPSKIKEMIAEIEKDTDTTMHTLQSLSEESRNSAKLVSPLRDYIETHFARLVGKCIYMSITCRPDISVRVSKCARGMHKPESDHVRLMYNLLKYLNGTYDRGLVYEVDSPCSKMLTMYQETRQGQEAVAFLASSPCVAFSDANWADKDDSELRSTSGYTVHLFGCTVAWHTKRQTLTAASTMQAELIAAATCSDEVKWFHNVLSCSPLIFGSCGSIPIFVDNESALSIANHPKTTPKSKFLDLRLYRIRDYQRDGLIRPLWIPTKLNIADGFTKTLGKELFGQFVKLLGMSSLNRRRKHEESVSYLQVMKCELLERVVPVNRFFIMLD